MLTRIAASLAAGLAWLGRHGTQGFALSIFLEEGGNDTYNLEYGPVATSIGGFWEVSVK